MTEAQKSQGGVKTGIFGLDQILKGGIRRKNSVLITGTPGTGKTILALQFILAGAKNGEAGLYITAEESVESICNCAESIGLNIKKYIDNKLITILEQPISDGRLAVSFDKPLRLIESKKIKRVVVDSLTLLEYIYGNSPLGFRKSILGFITKVKKANATLLVTSEAATGGYDNFIYRAQDYLFDGLIILTKIRKGSSFERCLSIVKMRGQEHMVDVYPFSIKSGGIAVYPDQIPFSLIEKDIPKR